MGIPEQVGQVVLVVSESMNSPRGEMRLFERQDGSWHDAAGAMRTVLGRNGLGWGLGLPSRRGDGPLKKEGDGKSPAGVFEIGEAFGYAPLPPPACRLPYRPIGQDDYFVDDAESPDYNAWVTLSPREDPRTRWNSYERMKREDGLYEHGIVVKHNMDPIVPGMGSAIFLHVWRGEGEPTAGCTALSKENLLALLAWLDPSKKPLLIQLPETELDKFRLQPALH
jgi:L,D-peptidoglycan transpeptidase YkuD (ErfK/YbiS/YcfS/YnhG family)